MYQGCIYDQENVDSLRYAHEHGFTIASHTWNHYDITSLPLASLGASLDLLETALLKILGVKPALFRPPYGSISDEYVEYLNGRGYTVVGWSIDSGDSVGVGYDEQVANVRAAGEWDIVLEHEVHAQTVQQLVTDTVPWLVLGGQKVVTVDVCLDVKPYQGSPVGYGVRDETWTCEGTPAPGGGW
jgi:peptidoglycan/xylan/chitin deacetylase (PgdA/CDA1 family)